MVGECDSSFFSFTDNFFDQRTSVFSRHVKITRRDGGYGYGMDMLSFCKKAFSSKETHAYICCRRDTFEPRFFLQQCFLGTDRCNPSFFCPMVVLSCLIQEQIYHKRDIVYFQSFGQTNHAYFSSCVYLFIPP